VRGPGSSWCRRVPPGIACVDGAAFAEGFGEGVAESLVVGLQFADALGGDLEATQQGEF
jgi:hypothetical protein